MIEKTLEKIGLSKKAVKVYLTILNNSYNLLNRHMVYETFVEISILYLYLYILLDLMDISNYYLYIPNLSLL